MAMRISVIIALWAIPVILLAFSWCHSVILPPLLRNDWVSKRVLHLHPPPSLQSLLQQTEPD